MQLQCNPPHRVRLFLSLSRSLFARFLFLKQIDEHRKLIVESFVWSCGNSGKQNNWSTRWKRRSVSGLTESFQSSKIIVEKEGKLGTNPHLRFGRRRICFSAWLDSTRWTSMFARLPETRSTPFARVYGDDGRPEQNSRDFALNRFSPFSPDPHDNTSLIRDYPERLARHRLQRVPPNFYLHENSLLFHVSLQLNSSQISWRKRLLSSS